MVTDAILLYQLVNNVLNGLMELAKNSDHRNHYWRVRLHYHSQQLQFFVDTLRDFDLPLRVKLDEIDELFQLRSISTKIGEGYTNVTISVRGLEDNDVATFALRDIEKITVLNNTSIESTQVH